MTTVEKPASLIEESAAQILTTVVERGLRPEVLQRTMAAIFADWAKVAEQEQEANLLERLKKLGITFVVARSENETHYTIRYQGSYGLAEDFNTALVNLIEALLRDSKLLN
jgi:hypothetical protein